MHYAHVYVYMYVCTYTHDKHNDFRKPLSRKFIFWYAGITSWERQVKFIYEGHRVKVKVTRCYHVSFLSPAWLIQTIAVT